MLNSFSVSIISKDDYSKIERNAQYYFVAQCGIKILIILNSVMTFIWHYNKKTGSHLWTPWPWSSNLSLQALSTLLKAQRWCEHNFFFKWRFLLKAEDCDGNHIPVALGGRCFLQAQAPPVKISREWHSQTLQRQLCAWRLAEWMKRRNHKHFLKEKKKKEEDSPVSHLHPGHLQNLWYLEDPTQNIFKKQLSVAGLSVNRLLVNDTATARWLRFLQVK